jgi:arylsulfatase A-like enzyme
VPQRFLDMYEPSTIRLPDNYRDNLLDKPALYQKTQAPFLKLTDDEHREALRHYLAFCTYEDYLFGRLVDALKESGQYEDTIIIYTSDHGDYAGAHGLWAKGLPCFREAYRVPFVVRMPGLSGMRTVDDRASLCDFAPTVLDLAGIEYGQDRFAGRSLAGELTDAEKTLAPAHSFTQSNGNELYGIQRSIESDKWKYVFNGFDYDELYDLENDPGERCNLARDGRYADVIREMCRELWRFARKNLDTYINPYIVTAHMPYGPGIAGDDLFE